MGNEEGEENVSIRSAYLERVWQKLQHNLHCEWFFKETITSKHIQQQEEAGERRQKQ